MMKKEQKFYSALQDLFVGAKLNGKSGYVNLMNFKTEYFERIKKKLETEISEKIGWDGREILFDYLNTFFESYFSAGGSIYFSSTPVYKNIYSKVYSDRQDTALFWKTKDLYYVKSEANYKTVEGLTLTDNEKFKFNFNADELEHKKNNEKKELKFLFIGYDNKTDVLIFKVIYSNSINYDRLKEILKLKTTDDVKKYLFDNFPNIKKEGVIITKNDLDLTKLNFKNKNKSTIKAEFNIKNTEDELFKEVEIEPAITDTKEIEKYLSIVEQKYITEEDIKKAFSIYKKQTEVDYFIHKDAGKFLKEQFKLFVYQYLTEDFETVFDKDKLDFIRKIKKIAYSTIEYIAKFEDELKRIWLKPKFVQKSNYVVTLDRIAEKDKKLKLIDKIIKHKNFKQQEDEWKELGMIEESFKKSEIIENDLTGEHLNNKHKYLPIDTKYFKDLEIKILSLFDNLDSVLDGWLIKSDNFQALNTILPKFKEKVQTIYIDPPFNTGSDFSYIDKYQDSTWLTLINNRLELAQKILNEDGTLFLHLDYNADYLGRELLNSIFGYENFRNSIVWSYKSSAPPKMDFQRNHNIILRYSKTNKYFFNIQYDLYSESTKKRFDQIDKEGKRYKIVTKRNKQFIVYMKDQGTPADDVWYYQIIVGGSAESFNFITQKPEQLLNRIIISSSDINHIIMDFFSGTGTTLSSAHKLKRKWLGVEMGEHFYTIVLPRMKKVLFYDSSGISKEKDVKEKYNKNKAGGFFKYYELEQYEDTLRNACYRPVNDKLENIDFKINEKLAEKGLKLDYDNEKAYYTFENIYKDIDIVETISNLSGWKIKKIKDEKTVIYFDELRDKEIEVDINNLTYKEYPFLKNLIWW